MTAELDVSVNPGSVTAGLASVAATITYTCTVSTPDGQAQLRVDFDQAGNDTSGEAGVPCGPGDVDRTQTITAVQVGMNDTQDISAVANLDDGGSDVIASTDSIRGVRSLHIDPTATFPGGGTITVTGSYTCTEPGTFFIIKAHQNNGPTDIAAGVKSVGATCDGANHGYSATVTSSTGNPFRDSGYRVYVDVSGEAPIPISVFFPGTSSTTLADFD